MSAKIYDIVTERIIGALDKGVIPWRQPWHSRSAPTNAVSKNSYRGINRFLLPFEYDDQRYVSYKQAADLGGNVKRGERGHMVVFWKSLAVERQTAEGEVSERTIPLLRYYTVFNIAQCEGLRINTEAAPAPVATLPAADAVVSSMTNAPSIQHDQDRAYYVPASDEIHMPPQHRFENTTGYYSTLYHELTHSTGHPSRLNRPGVETVAPFGSENYGREELVAEFGAAFLCCAVGIDSVHPDNHIAYIQSWRRAIKNDPKALVVAASQAQKAADHILGVEIDPIGTSGDFLRFRW